jgi:hypothetical protein
MTSAGGAVLELGCHHDALLLVRIRPRPDEHRGHGAPVDRDVGHPGRDVEVVADLRDLAVLQLVAGPELHLVTAEEEEAGLVVRVDVRLRPSTGRDRHGSQPQGPRADALRADPRRVVGPLLALVALPGPHHGAGCRPCAVHAGTMTAGCGRHKPPTGPRRPPIGPYRSSVVSGRRTPAPSSATPANSGRTTVDSYCPNCASFDRRNNLGGSDVKSPELSVSSATMDA